MSTVDKTKADVKESLHHISGSNNTLEEVESILKPHKIDLSIFEHDKDQYIIQCDQNNNDPIEGCDALKRLIYALKYYALLDIVKSKENQDIFSAFIGERYVQCLDDYVHLVNKHNNLEEIHKSLKEKILFDECDVRKCSFASRHHSNDRNDNNNTSMDNLLKVYANIMDSFHFYIFHLFECGLRTERTVDIDDTKDNNMDNKFFDKQFQRISRMINERQHLNASFNRLKNNTKFNISIEAKEQKETDASLTCFMDALCRFLLSNNIKQTVLTKFIDFIICYDYDSESVKIDFKEETYRNIAQNIDDKTLIGAVVQFIRTTELHSSSYSIGLIFYYWPHYENMDQFDQNIDSDNINDHNGYKISELFVKQRYPNFKEEIMNCVHIKMVQYESLMIKVKVYMEIESVRQRRADIYIDLRYGIEDGDALLSHHLLAVCLYTDYTELSHEFSGTFRAINQFETLSSIKRRNSEYYWMSKHLREIVELYGEHRTWDASKEKVGGLLGPFYCGVSKVMTFPEFEVRLCGPTSTTKQLTVATKFAGTDGVVVQLNNTVFGHKYLSGLSCSWLSNYAEEDEVVFVGGHHRVKIESIRILTGKDGRCQNFKPYFSALCKFNKMFNGGVAYAEDSNYVDNKKKISKDEKEIVTKLFEWRLGVCELKEEVDEYILDSFETFTQNKQHIVFNYYYMLYYNNDEDLRDLIFYGMKRNDIYNVFKPSKEEKTNIFRKTLFKVFPNIKNIDIYSTGISGYCPLSLLSLLSEIEKESFNEIRVKGSYDCTRGNASWIYLLWLSSSEELQQKFEEKGYNILLQKRKDVQFRNKDVDCLVIKKM